MRDPGSHGAAATATGLCPRVGRRVVRRDHRQRLPAARRDARQQGPRSVVTQRHLGRMAVDGTGGGGDQPPQRAGAGGARHQGRSASRPAGQRSSAARLAKADMDAVEAAGQAGRLYVPTRSLPEDYDVPRPFATAPVSRCQVLHEAYRVALDASVQAARALDELSIAAGAPSKALALARAAASAQSSRRGNQPRPDDGIPVPPGAGQYRFVRVRVLIFPGARSCIGFALAAKVLVSHHYGPPPQARFPDPAASGRAGLALRALTTGRTGSGGRGSR